MASVTTACPEAGKCMCVKNKQTNELTNKTAASKREINSVYTASATLTFPRHVEMCIQQHQHKQCADAMIEMNDGGHKTDPLYTVFTDIRRAIYHIYYIL